MTATASEPHDFPMARKSGCPFDPPPEMYAAQRDAGGAPTRVKVMDGSTPWMITRYEHARRLLADPRISNDATLSGYPIGFEVTREMQEAIGFILMDGDEHARLRKMVTGPFTVRRIKAMRPFVEEVVDRQIGHLLDCEKPADLVEEFALPVPSLVICDLLGVPYEDHGFFQKQSGTFISTRATAEQRAESTAALTNYLIELIGKKGDAPGDDVLTGLAERVADGDLTAEQAGQMGMLLLFAGHETTANMIALGTAALLGRPGQLAKLRGGDPAVTASAVEEMLRYLTITHNGLKRVAVRDIELDGVTIKAGEGVLIAAEAANRDPHVFADPDEIDIERQQNRHLAFSFGVHQCLGQQLARLELEVVYGKLYRRIPDLALAIDPAEIKYKYDGFVYGVYELPVTW